VKTLPACLDVTRRFFSIQKNNFCLYEFHYAGGPMTNTPGEGLVFFKLVEARHTPRGLTIFFVEFHKPEFRVSVSHKFFLNKTIPPFKQPLLVDATTYATVQGCLLFTGQL
jgi:hypothetical protein